MDSNTDPKSFGTFSFSDQVTYTLIIMDAIEFVINYPNYLQEIRDVVRPELFPLLDELEKIDPHDLVSPDTWFVNEISARGYVWSLFLKREEKLKNEDSID